jgi:hypothetical protein
MDKGLLVTLAGAVLAALGYVGKQLADFVTAQIATRRVRRARLLRLYSLLRTGRVIFEVQNDLTRELLGEISQNHAEASSPELAEAGFDEIFAHLYANFTAAERNLHSVIRGQTINAMRSVNTELSTWLSDDDFYKIFTGSARGIEAQRRAQLAKLLGDLEVHLRPWHAKYETWIVGHPEHALVYLADEERHGPGFPAGLDQLVAELAGAAPQPHR